MNDIAIKNDDKIFRTSFHEKFSWQNISAKNDVHTPFHHETKYFDYERFSHFLS